MVQRPSDVVEESRKTNKRANVLVVLEPGHAASIYFSKKWATGQLCDIELSATETCNPILWLFP